MGLTVAEKRNVIVIGKCGAGKSTVANCITGTNRFAVSSGLDGNSKDTMAKHAEVELATNGCKYVIKVVDTVGLFKPGIASHARKANKGGLRQVMQYIRDTSPEGVSVILFVFREGRFTREEDAAFKAIMDIFGNNISEMSALVITNCENLSEEERKVLVREFKTEDRTAQIARFMGKGIYPVGFPNITEMRAPLRDAYKEGIEADTKTLRQLIIESGEMRLPRELFDESSCSGIRCSIL